MTDFQAAKAIHFTAKELGQLKLEYMQRDLALAAKLEADLRASGVSSIMIPGILAAAFIASLTNLSREHRVTALQAHLSGVRDVLQSVLGAEQAPDGPLETL